MKDRLKIFWKFVREDIWDIELTSLTKLKRLGVKSLRVVHLVFKGFKDDECPLHASALTFNSLMAIVPILALSLSLARVFGGAELAETQLKQVVGEITSRLEVRGNTNNMAAVKAEGVDVVVDDGVWTPSEIASELNKAVDLGFRQVEKVNFTALGSAGLILLLWMVIVVLSKVEGSFNTVWGVTQGRPFFRKITDYLFMVIVMPFLISMLASFFLAELAVRFTSIPLASEMAGLISTKIWKNLAVLTLIMLTITLLLKFMPNTQVHWRPALIGGLVVALLLLLWLWFCARVQVGVARNSALYGSFAIVPIVLFWVFVSWEIVLFGAEVAFATQNCATYRMEYGSKRANVQSRLILGLSVIVEAGKAMMGKADYFEVAKFASTHRVPVRFLNDIVDELVRLEFLASVGEQPGRFVMLKPPSEVSVRSVIDAMMGSGVKPEALGLMNVNPAIEQIVKTSTSSIGGSLSEKYVADIV